MAQQGEAKRARTGNGRGPPDGAARLSALRAELARLELDAFVVPSDDPHQSEYVATCYERRAFISGFRGSSGTAVVTATEALLWTDGRYFLQAAEQLFDGWTLMKDRLPETVPIDVWLAGRGDVRAVGYDPLLASSSGAVELRASLVAAGKELRALRENPVDLVWGADRPPHPSAPAFSHDEAVAGVTVGDKLRALEGKLVAAGADTLVVAALDEVAWLLNVRGADIAFCPVSYAYALVRREKSGRLGLSWLIDAAKVPAPVLERLRASAASAPLASAARAAEGGAACAPAEVELRGYDQIVAAIEQEVKRGRVLLVPTSASAALHERVPPAQRRALPSPIAMLKARKNEAEVRGMREAHLRDARALVRFLAWLERTDGGRLPDGAHNGHGKSEEGAAQRVDEVEAAARLERFRMQEAGYVGPSFETISAYGGNGAVIHYTAQAGSCARLGGGSLFLCDSGGQYSCGTTDVTRTVHLRPADADAHVRACWTRVLKAHIAVDSLVFPEGTTGYQLDAVARAPLWKAGLDYRHGTGHGVGAFLNVHEGPHGMSLTRITTNDTGLEEGMTLSNEPGAQAGRSWPSPARLPRARLPMHALSPASGPALAPRARVQATTRRATLASGWRM